jgi:hypothetical protein
MHIRTMVTPTFLFKEDKGGGGGGDDAPKTFTQDQVNDLIAREKGKIQAKYDGFDDLKAKADKFDEQQAAGASDLEKANQRAEAAEAKAAKADEKVRHANLLSALADKKLVGAAGRAAAKLLDGVEFDDNDEPKNLDDALKAAKTAYGEAVFSADGTTTNEDESGDKPGEKGKPKGKGGDGGAGGTHDAVKDAPPGMARLAAAYAANAKQ